MLEELRLREQLETSAQLYGRLSATYLTAVDLRIPKPHGISCIRFVFVIVTRFATS
jgi:hypothetical protein